MRGRAVERRLDAEMCRRVDDHLADRRGVVEDEAEVAAQARGVERARAGERDLLADGEQQLDVDRRTLAAHVARERQHHGDRGLVVGAEDAVVRVLPAVSSSTGSTGARSGTVSRCAHSSSERPFGALLRGARPVRGDEREQVAAVRARDQPRVVLVDLDAERAQLRDHALRAGALVARRALDPAQLGERPVQVAALELPDS